MIEARAYCDGRGNAGTGACAAVLFLSGGPRHEDARKLEPCTNNIAEYEGVRMAMRLAKKHGVTHLRIHSDSQLIVNQINGTYKCKDPRMAHLRDRCWAEAEKFEQVKIVWVPREANTDADKLCRKVDPSVRRPVEEMPDHENPFLRANRQ